MYIYTFSVGPTTPLIERVERVIQGSYILLNLSCPWSLYRLIQKCCIPEEYRLAGTIKTLQNTVG